MGEAFDVGRARTFRPKPEFVKTAVLVDPTDPDAITELSTPFGMQRLQGSFYVVAEGEQSYGAAQREFETSHVWVGPNRWAKSEPVSAYRTDDACTIITTITNATDTSTPDHIEATVEAEPGDWIVQQITGEVMVVRPEEFAARYVDND
jgi:hypothetical protein